MSRRPDIDAGALTAALLQAVTEARAAQTALEEAAKGGNASKIGPSIEAIRERLALLAELRDMGMEIIRALDKQLRPAHEAAGPHVALPLLTEASVAFAKLSRAIRLIMMLEQRADEALRAALAGPRAAATGPLPRSAREPATPEVTPPEITPEPETAGDSETLAEAEHLAEREPAETGVDPEETAAALRRAAAAGRYDDIRAAARERLFLDRHYADFLTRPLDRLIPDLCRDLGLTPARLREAGCESRLEIRPPRPPPPPPLPRPGLQPRPRAMASALAGASHLAFTAAATFHPPDSKSRPNPDTPSPPSACRVPASEPVAPPMASSWRSTSSNTRPIGDIRSSG